MVNCLTQYYRCPDRFIQIVEEVPEDAAKGFFSFNHGTICYGNSARDRISASPNAILCDASEDCVVSAGRVTLPFDASEVADNLRREAYVDDWRQGTSSVPARLYYLIRPILAAGVRKHLQRFHLRDWQQLTFPRWPVDFSVDNLMEKLLQLSLRASGARSIPFIWFWPDGYSSSAIMTHDVETRKGRDFCPTLMDIDDSYGIKASFQIIPEERYGVTQDFLDLIRSRQFEIAIHDLNHDGHLYKSREQFLRRAIAINSYGRTFQTEGFRAAVLYRKQLWYDALQFSYDMSIPNVAHLDPQRGGCCTAKPFFIGKILEIPVTMVQDYTLFKILNEYSIGLWRKQIGMVMEKHGLMSFIVHPDYLDGARERAVYEELLSYLTELHCDRGVWITTPS